MAMNATTLAALIVTKWTANPNIGFSNPMTAQQQAIVQALADGVAQAVISHIQTYAVVTGVQGGGGTAPIT